MIGIIGGTGLLALAALDERISRRVSTPWGDPSAELTVGHWHGQAVAFLPRHGDPHAIPPHAINYRANVWALKEAGVTDIIAVNTVGGIHADCDAGRLVIVDDVIDYTWGREHSYHDGISGTLEHVDLSEPYDAALRQQLVDAVKQAGLACRDHGVYAATQGPRLETPAEIRRLKRDGCDVVGMTGMPEVALARELGLAYACICLVVNPAAGLSDEPITMEAIQQVLQTGAGHLLQVLDAFLSMPDD
ncbi:MAG TPA: S-methyl-5'-thioinosine phosphorylase [Pseudomonadales bacterium]|jgi:5'-deoxy-5'-methylthioadenosine phosphorylase